MIEKIVSGGQTGADQAGLDAAQYCGIPYGGWIPKGRKCEAGVIPESYEGLQEMTSALYIKRTEANVVDSDATLIMTFGAPRGGSKATLELAAQHDKPCLHVDLTGSRRGIIAAIVRWLKSECPSPCVLNVAGSRASKARGIHDYAKAILVEVISDVNGTTYYPLRAGSSRKAAET